ncbi:MAG: SDR family NAD(P)-dependent oxidoreductase [Acidimicrobiales bacterium]|nr:SDR family NAD(P)-dependent oxidoreductase [Acidimicrobiales bacterium]
MMKKSRNRRRLGSVELNGALVVVTGAGSGIGKASAEAFSNSGSTVISLDKNAEAAQKTAASCGGYSFQVDVSNREAMAELAESIGVEYGVPDVLVNNAGVGMSGRFLDTSGDDWDWIMNVNLKGVINGCAAFGPLMMRRGSGHISNVASGLAYFPRATEPAYVTTKAGVLALSQCLRADWAKSGVGVSVICPGVINTPIISTSRFLGERGSEKTAGKVQKVFSKGHDPSLVAKAIVRAARRNSRVVPVGFESWVGWYMNGLVPGPLVDLIARAQLGGV